MTTMMGSHYVALKAAGVSEDLAQQAAEEAASYHVARRRAEYAVRTYTRLPEMPMWVLKVLFTLNVVSCLLAILGH